MGNQQNPDGIPRAIGDTRRYLDQKPTRPQLFQVKATFGNFDSYQEAQEFKKHLLGEKGIIPSSVEVRGSYK